jgi:hypothetical protein
LYIPASNKVLTAMTASRSERFPNTVIPSTASKPD